MLERFAPWRAADPPRPSRGVRTPLHPMQRVGLLTATLICLATAALAGVPSPKRQAELDHMLRHDCGSCHGMTLKGGLGAPLLPESLQGKSDESLVEAILGGLPGTPMPPWRGLLSQEDAAWMVARLRAGGAK